jgi:DNA-binding transcriptional regulator YhcF (GntR family)
MRKERAIPSPPVATRLLARDVQRILLRRIAEGRYEVGERLPSCERFGREIGANKNTVSKAYRALAERGYVSAAAGRGTFVTARPPAADAGAFVGEIESLLALVVEQAYAGGVSLEDLERVVGEEIRRRYDRARLRVGYVECNVLEATKFSRELEELLATQVEPLLLDDFLADTETLTEQFDVIAVDLSHLADVQKRLNASPSRRAEIVPMLTLPDPESLAEVARLAPETRLGVLAETPEGLSALAGLVQAVNPTLATKAALVRRREEFDRVVAGSDVLLVSEAVHQHRDGTLDAKQLIDAPFKLDRRSIEALTRRIAERRRAAAGSDRQAAVPPKHLATG